MKKVLCLSLIALALVGCDDDDHDDDFYYPYPPTVTPTPPTTPTTPPAAAVGLIEALDAQQSRVQVNGDWYPVNAANYAGEPVPFADLRVNMNASVKADSNNTDNGTQLTLEPTITGTISGIDRATGGFTVNGVVLTFPELDPTIVDGDWVMVSTVADPSGGYKVVSVVKMDKPAFVAIAEIEGRVSALDLNTNTFSLGGGPQINFDASTVIYGGSLADGQWVEITGEMQGNVFYARVIEIESYDRFDADDFYGDFEIDGIVTWIAADKSEMELNYRGRINIPTNTAFIYGNREMLTVGRHIEVITYRDAQGGTAARVIEFDDDFYDGEWAGYEFECKGTATQYTGTSFSMTCGYPAKTISIEIDAYTQFEGIYPANLEGAFVDVEGIIQNQRYIAREIESGYDFD